MSDILIIKALIKLNPVEKGKKEINYKSGVMPNHYIPELSGFTVGKIDFINKSELISGEEVEANVTFLYGEMLKDIIQEGYEWPIHEGPSWNIGCGKVIKVLKRP